MRTFLTILIIAAILYVGIHGFGFIIGLFGGILGLIVGIIGGVAGILGSIIAVVFGIGIGIFGALLPLIILALIVAGIVHLFKAA